jgi:hypothetical protein
MFTQIRHFLTFLLVFITLYLPAQDLTGTWEGDLGNDQFLQLNIIQNGDKICGFSRDYVVRDRRSSCTAYFEAKYNKKKKIWMFNGTSFVHNSGSHILMQMTLYHDLVDGKEVLDGYSGGQSFLYMILSGGTRTRIFVRKVSGKPSEILPLMKDCFEKKQKNFDTVKIKDTVKIIVDPDTLKKIVTLPVPLDTVKKINPDLRIKTDSIPIQLETRINKEQSHIEVNEKNLTLNVYDNAVIDGDTVSIFYNGKLLLSKQKLTDKGFEIKLELDENKTRHEITLFAHNLGSIPPNTALIVIYVGKKRYELFASASLDENAVLVFDYVPKKKE